MSIATPKQSVKASTKFRADLNFLRALAVAVVVLFHFKITLFSGGYIGVDVFFVISGFLMTKIIYTGLSADQFSLFKFYLARAKRIIPALIFLCLILLVVGWFFLLPSEYRLLSKHAASSLTFLSNLIYLNEAGYFDPASHEKWLLHTWSLSVEWQFYIIYPVILLVLKRFLGQSRLPALIVAMAVLSFAYMLYLGGINSRSLYFGLAGRAWEMLAGGLVFLFPYTFSRNMKSLLFYGGLIFILFSAMFFNNTQLWPSLWALVPILGTVMVIYSHENTNKLVTNRFVKYLGITSYSVYLWHWPVVAAIAVFSLGYSIENILLGIALSIGLGGLSYRFIETSINNVKGAMLKQFSIVLGAAMMVFGLSVVVFLKNGFPIELRFNKAVIAADQEYLNRDPKKAKCLTENVIKSPHCVYGNKEQKVAAILFGDSHASAIVNVLTKALVKQGSVLFIAQPGCMSVFSMQRNGKVDGTCSEFVQNEVKYITSHYPNIPVVMINRWSYYLKGKVGQETPLVYFEQKSDSGVIIAKQFENKLSDTLCMISQSNPVFLVKPIPEFKKQLPKQVARQINQGQSGDVKISMASYKQRNSLTISAIDQAGSSCGATLLDPTDYLCPHGECLGVIDNMPLYYDDNHLSESGNQILLPMFSSAFDNQIQSIR